MEQTQVGVILKNSDLHGFDIRELVEILEPIIPSTLTECLGYSSKFNTTFKQLLTENEFEILGEL